MLLGALAFALGARTGADDAVRRGASRAFVSLGFEPSDALRERLAADGFELDDGEDAVVEREMTDAGRSNVRINGRAARAGYLRELGDAIAEIVGQHEHQRLLASSSLDTRMLDRFANAGGPREAVAAAHARAAAIAEELERLGGDERRALRDYEDARFAVEEIVDAVAIQVTGEDDKQAKRASRVLGQHRQDRGRVADGERSARRRRRQCDRIARRCERGALRRRVDVEHARNARANGRGQRFRVRSTISPRTSGVRSTKSRAIRRNSKPSMLDWTHSTSSSANTGARWSAFWKRPRRLAPSSKATNGATSTRRSSRRSRLSAEKALASAAETALTKLRKKAAVELARLVAAEFDDLALGSARFDVELASLERIGAAGAERAEFAFAANPGEPMRALARVASGGELSRVLLALVVVLAGNREGGAR